MTSEKQVEANRRNAAKSTGAKTVQGQQIARMNALKHGLRAQRVVIPGEDPEEFEGLLLSLEEYYQPVGSVENLLVERIAYCAWRLQRVNLIETTLMHREHFTLERTRANAEMERARKEMNWIARAFAYDPDEIDLEEEDSDDADDINLPEDEAEALKRNYDKAERAYQRAKEAYDRAEDELKSQSCSLDLVFLRSTEDLERLSRYETTIERRLRNAMQDLERVQAARKAEAAETATVIDLTDLGQGES